MFALANSKELLNTAASVICQKCLKLEAKIMTFSSVKKNKQDWYAFKFAKEQAGTYSYKGTMITKLGAMPSDFIKSWKEALNECGKILGNNGVVFVTFLFTFSYIPATVEPMAFYSCPEGYDYMYSSTLESAWGKSFDKPLSNPVYLIGKSLVPYELFHTPDYSNIEHYRSENDDVSEIYADRERATESRCSRANKKNLEMLKIADPRKRQGYYLVTNENPETIPF